MLKAENISKSFVDRSNGKTFELLHNVSLELKPGEAVALMGGSGSGKSTLARILLRLLPCDCGKIYFQGQDITNATGKNLSSFRRNVQFISQRPESFLDPRQTLGSSLREAFTVFNLPYDEEKIKAMLDLVKLNVELLQRYPHQVSGGEIQRICLVRALLLEPKLLILDEPLNGLDKHGVREMRQLIKGLKEQGKTILLASHNQGDIDELCDTVCEMDAGVMTMIREESI